MLSYVIDFMVAMGRLEPLASAVCGPILYFSVRHSASNYLI